MSTTRTACEPRIAAKLDDVANVSGLSTLKTTITAIHAPTSANRSTNSPTLIPPRSRWPSEAVSGAHRRIPARVEMATGVALGDAVALLRDPLLGDLIACQLARDASATEDHDPVTDRRELLVVGAYANHGRAVGCGLPRQLEDLLAGSDVDALRRLVE